MEKQLLFLTMSATILTACASSQPNDGQSSVSSSVSEEASSRQSSQSNASSSVEESVSSEPIEEESSSEELTWSSMDEAIDFYENTLIAEKGEELAGIGLNGEFYERDMWELVQNEGDTIVLFKPNLGRGDGRNAIEFVKGEENTEITFFKYNTPYPDQPGKTKTYRNEDYVRIDKDDSPLTWESMDEAVEFYENTYKNTSNEISKDIAWENYDRSAWSLEELEGNHIVLHWTNIGGAGGSYVEFYKGREYTEILEYDGNASYPGAPTKQYIVRNIDFVVVPAEEMGN
ncbi:hypothetical protein [Jeotgalibaca ciconiae]|uniref:Uncharacterized protein n=1 Tax=Jeotgalibaca ciconiae TaxID=2496265 RepID=A0A3Q9BK69_9LACT|nr:hypothetical protein [Jeotgalibaca ciconiae]AZP04304.1 hypothetical protein EJN90_06425 [Jeotgalibaca ciconiae]